MIHGILQNRILGWDKRTVAVKVAAHSHRFQTYTLGEELISNQPK